MSRKYIFNDKNIINLGNNVLKLTGDELKHMFVLRYKIGEEVIINNYLCDIQNINKDNITVKIKEELKIFVDTRISVFQSYLKGSKTEFIVQKLTELGINKIVPFLSKNTVVKFDSKSKIKKKNKLEVISKEAIKQSGRLNDVIINDIIEFKEILLLLSEYDLVILAYENSKLSLKDSLNSLDKNIYKNIAVIVGCEGSFSEKEIEELSKLNNMILVNLGDNILRAETANIYLSSIINYEFR